jgi:uncharacterized protein
MENSMQSQVIKETAEYVREQLKQESSGHDWWHIYRVWQMARYLATTEPAADRFVVELAALLHDIADWKFHDGDETLGPQMANDWLGHFSLGSQVTDHVCDIIRHISFKGAGVATPMRSIEGMIVQDADRIDALGAIGIARTFAFGSYKGSQIHDPEQTPRLHTTIEQYKARTSTTINHFYEKLLLLKDRMNTQAARVIAMRRHKIMEEFLREFLLEWDAGDVEKG